MNTRRFGISAALGGAAILWLVGVRTIHHSLHPVIGERAAAQTPDIASITVKSLPHTAEFEEDPWNRFEITVPPTNPPLDMHVVFFVDGKGSDFVSGEAHAWDQPLPFKYRLDHDDDSRVKDILEAQGLPIKKNLVTYRFGVGTHGSVSINQTIRFRHELGVQQWVMGNNDIMQGAIGTKILLENRMLSDENFNGDLNKVGSVEQQLQPGFAPKTLPGMVHHLAVYLMFTPHQGRPARGSYTIGKKATP